MKKIAIITDSDSSLPAEVAQEYDIPHVPITVHFGEESYAASVDINDEQLFKRIDEVKKLPTTAAPAPGVFAKTFQAALDQGAESVICICVSSKISATYGSAVTAAEMFPGRDITVVDSLSVSMGQGFMVLAAAEAARKGASTADILAQVESMKTRTYLYGALSTLKYLAMSGRVGKLAAGFADTLNIKPVLKLQDGKLELLEKVRTHKKALERMLDLTAESLSGRPVQRCAVLHVCNLEGALAFRDQLCQKLGCPADTMICEFTAGLSVHTGAGMLGVAVLAG